MTKIIGVVQLKGGAGRSTISINLAAELSRQHQVTIIDCDLPQGTTSSWYALRLDTDKTGDLALASARDHKELIQQIKQYTDQDYIVIDAPPRIAEVTRTILILADLLIIPVASTAIDFWATHDLLEIIEDAAKQSQNLIYKILWNRCRRGTRSTNELQRLVKDEGYPSLESTLGLRVAYPDSIAEGLIATECSDKKAVAELQELTKEVKQLCN